MTAQHRIGHGAPRYNGADLFKSSLNLSLYIYLYILLYLSFSIPGSDVRMKLPPLYVDKMGSTPRLHDESVAKLRLWPLDENT